MADDEEAPGGLGTGFNSGSSSRQFSLFGKNVASFGSKFEFKIPGLSDTTKDIKGLNDELDSLSKRISKLTTQAPGIKTFFGSISEGAKTALSDVKNLNSAMGSTGGGSGVAVFSGGNSSAFAGAGGGSSMFGGSANAAISGSSIGGSAYGQDVTDAGIGDIVSSTLGTPGGSGAAAVVQALIAALVKPMQLAYNRVEENRAATMRGAGYLGNVATRGGMTSIPGLMSQLASPNSGVPILGSYDDQLAALSLGSRMGFGISGSNPNLNGGFWTAARQYQEMNPGTTAPNIVQSLGGFMGNAQAVQKSVMYTGGAFSFQAAGGGQKSMQDWAAGILKFFQDQRPGANRGKPFSKADLEVQQFPGSNIDAWFQLNDVPPDMRDAWWQYAIGSASTGSASWDEIISKTRGTGATGSDLVYQRLQGETLAGRRDLTMAAQPTSAAFGGALGGGGTMYGAYSTREASDAAFNDMLSRTLDKALPTLLQKIGIGNLVGNIPTPVANMLFQTVMSLPSISGKLAGLAPFVGGDTAGDPGYRRGRGIGDVGGSYGDLGSTSLFGMTPTMQDRLGSMMADNPNLSITSGYRDGATQSRLFANGVGSTAPAGQSTHAQGVAADIGPDSEYGWIAANASAYGLQVAGDEPWHVGLPGTMPIMGDPRSRKRGGIGDSNLPGLSITAAQKQQLIDAGFKFDDKGNVTSPNGFTFKASGLNQSTWSALTSGLKSIGSGVTAGATDVLGLLRTIVSFMDPGGFASLAEDLLTGDSASAMEKAKAKIFSMIPGMASIQGANYSTTGGISQAAGQIAGFATNTNIRGTGQSLMPSTFGSSTGLGATPGGGGTGGTGGTVAPNPDPWGVISGGTGGSTGNANVQQILKQWNGGNVNVTPDESVKRSHPNDILRVLQVAKNAGFSGNQLVLMGAIAGRESTWDPSKSYQGPKDDSWGLWEINVLGSNIARLKQYGLTSKQQLLDPQTNARVAYGVSGKGTNFTPWGNSSGSIPPLHGQAANWVSPVYDIARMAGFVGDPRRRGATAAIAPYRGGGGGGGTSITGSPIVINVSMPIQTTRTSEPDARRLAQSMAATVQDTISSVVALHG